MNIFKRVYYAILRVINGRRCDNLYADGPDSAAADDDDECRSNTAESSENVNVSAMPSPGRFEPRSSPDTSSHVYLEAC